MSHPCAAARSCVEVMRQRRESRGLPGTRFSRASTLLVQVDLEDGASCAGVRDQAEDEVGLGEGELPRGTTGGVHSAALQPFCCRTEPSGDSGGLLACESEVLQLPDHAFVPGQRVSDLALRLLVHRPYRPPLEVWCIPAGGVRRLQGG